MQKKVRKAVIPVAGYGTRFLPFTKAVPKPMLPILNKPALQVISEEVVNSGITDILFIVGYKKEILESHFDAAPELEKMLAEKGKNDFLKEVVYPEKMAKFTYKIQEVRERYGKRGRSSERFRRRRTVRGFFSATTSCITRVAP